MDGRWIMEGRWMMDDRWMMDGRWMMDDTMRYGLRYGIDKLLTKSLCCVTDFL